MIKIINNIVVDTNHHHQYLSSLWSIRLVTIAQREGLDRFNRSILRGAGNIILMGVKSFLRGAGI